MMLKVLEVEVEVKHLEINLEFVTQKIERNLKIFRRRWIRKSLQDLERLVSRIVKLQQKCQNICLQEREELEKLREDKIFIHFYVNMLLWHVWQCHCIFIKI